MSKVYKQLEKNAPNGNVVFELVEGPYAGAQFYYGELSFDESDNNNPTLSFDFDVLNEEFKHYENDTDFKNLMGDTLMSIIEESLGDEKDTYTE